MAKTRNYSANIQDRAQPGRLPPVEGWPAPMREFGTGSRLHLRSDIPLLNEGPLAKWDTSIEALHSLTEASRLVKVAEAYCKADSSIVYTYLAYSRGLRGLRSSAELTDVSLIDFPFLLGVRDYLRLCSMGGVSVREALSHAENRPPVYYGTTTAGRDLFSELSRATQNAGDAPASRRSELVIMSGGLRIGRSSFVSYHNANRPLRGASILDYKAHRSRAVGRSDLDTESPLWLYMAVIAARHLHACRPYELRLRSTCTVTHEALHSRAVKDLSVPIDTTRGLVCFLMELREGQHDEAQSKFSEDVVEREVTAALKSIPWVIMDSYRAFP